MAKRNFFDSNLKASALVTLAFVLVCCGVYFYKNFGYSKEVLLQKAGDFFVAERYFMAAKYYAKAVELRASGADVFRNYGSALLKLANYNEAIKYLNLSLQEDPLSAESFYLLGNAYYLQGLSLNNSEKILRAAEELEKSINLDPGLEKSFLLIGSVYRSVGMQENARAWYRRALLSGNFSRAGFYNLIGHTFRDEERFKEAASYYQRSVEADYSFVAAYCNLGDMHANMNDDAKAEEIYKKAIEVNPDFATPYVKLGSIRASEGAYDDAIVWYAKALAVNEYDAKANYFLGKTYKEIGRKADAVEYFKKAASYGSDEALMELKNTGISLR